MSRIWKEINILRMKSDKKKILLAVLLSFFMMTALCWSVESNLSIVNTVCLWILGGIYWFCFLYAVVFRCYQNGNKKQRGIINFSACILSIVIIIFNWEKYDDIVAENYYERKMLENNIVSIKPLEDVNPEATAAEIWVNKIVVNDKDYNIESLNLSEGWRILDGYIYADDARAAQPLKLVFPANSCYEISFIMTEASGMVELFAGERPVIIDLCNAERTILDIDFRQMWESLQKVSMKKKLVFIIICFVMLSMIAEVILFYIARYCDRSRNIKKIFQSTEGSAFNYGSYKGNIPISRNDKRMDKKRTQDKV